ncbi:hypothetical protein JCM31598_28070 [Desulfonatronum parangueonense]
MKSTGAVENCQNETLPNLWGWHKRCYQQGWGLISKIREEGLNRDNAGVDGVTDMESTSCDKSFRRKPESCADRCSNPVG